MLVCPGSCGQLLDGEAAPEAQTHVSLVNLECERHVFIEVASAERFFSFFCAVLNTTRASYGEAQQTNACSITLVVSFAAGGGTDLAARVFARGLSKQLGQRVVVENVPGAASMLGTARVASSTPNGCTIGFGGTNDTVNQSLYQRPLYNLLTDLIPLGLVAEQPTVLIARKEFPANNLREFIAYAKDHQAESGHTSIPCPIG